MPAIAEDEDACEEEQSEPAPTGPMAEIMRLINNLEAEGTLELKLSM